MVNQTISDLLVIAIILVVGGFLFTQKPFWLKALGMICFTAALAQAFATPAFMLLVSLLVIGVALVKMFSAKRKKSRDQRDERDRGVHVHNYYR